MKEEPFNIYTGYEPSTLNFNDAQSLVTHDFYVSGYVK